MNFAQSSQLAKWQKPAGYAHPPQVQAMVEGLVWFLLDAHAKCGLGQQRKACVTAVHYLHRVVTRVADLERDLQASPREVALVLLFIAGKVEEVRWPITRHGCLQSRGFEMSQLARLADGEFSVQRFAELEVKLLDVLDYELVVHHFPLGRDEEQRENHLLAQTAHCLTNRGPESNHQLLL